MSKLRVNHETLDHVYSAPIGAELFMGPEVSSGRSFEIAMPGGAKIVINVTATETIVRMPDGATVHAGKRGAW